MALITPLLFGIAGAIITFGLAVHTRMQMIEMTHVAVRTCAISLPSSLSGVGSCVDSRLASLLTTTKWICTPAVGPTKVRQLAGISIPYAQQIFGVTGSLSCSFNKLGVPLLQLLPGGAPSAVTISAQSTAPFIPGTS